MKQEEKKSEADETRRFKKQSVIGFIGTRLMSGQKVVRNEVFHFSCDEIIHLWELSNHQSLVVMQRGKRFVGAKKRTEQYDDLIVHFRSLVQANNAFIQ